MSEQHNNAPGAGEPNSTPGTGAADAPGDGAPTSTSGLDLHQQGFTAGYGKGADKGRREGAELALKALGLPTDIDAAKAAIEQRQAQSTTPAEPVQAPDIRETQEYRALATEHRTVSQQFDELKERFGPLERRADEARLEKFKGAARSKGVGEGQLSALVAMHGKRVRLDDDGELEVLSAMPDGSMVAAGQTIESYLDDLVEENSWLLAPQQPQGAGSGLQGVVASSSGGSPVAGFDRRPLSERLKDSRS